MKGYTFKMTALTLLAVFMIVISMTLPSLSLSGAVSGIILCGNVIIPSLFPFCVIALFCFKSGVVSFLSRFTEPITKRVLHISGEQFCVFLMSFLAGYPIGIKLIRELAVKGSLSAEQAKRMSIYCVNAGPAFIITAIGKGILNSARLGRLIFISNLLASIILCFIAERKSEYKKTDSTLQKISIGDAFVESTAEAAQSVFGICAWVILFSSLIAILKADIFPSILGTLFSSLCEVTTATVESGGNIILTAAVISWGGFSVHCQVFSVGKSFMPSYPVFLVGRFFHAAISCAFTYALLKLDNRVIQTISNGVTVERHNTSMTYAGAVALIIMSVCLIISINERRKINYCGIIR